MSVDPNVKVLKRTQVYLLDFVVICRKSFLCQGKMGNARPLRANKRVESELGRRSGLFDSTCYFRRGQTFGGISIVRIVTQVLLGYEVCFPVGVPL